MPVIYLHISLAHGSHRQCMHGAFVRVIGVIMRKISAMRKTSSGHLNCHDWVKMWSLWFCSLLQNRTPSSGRQHKLQHNTTHWIGQKFELQFATNPTWVQENFKPKNITIINLLLRGGFIAVLHYFRWQTHLYNSVSCVCPFEIFVLMKKISHKSHNQWCNVNLYVVSNHTAS